MANFIYDKQICRVYIFEGLSTSEPSCACLESIQNSFKLKFAKQNMLEPAHNFDPELKQHYWAASFLLPLGSIFVLSVIILLMVLFKRCPHIIAGIVTGFLTTIIIFIIVISIKAEPIYT